MLGQSSFEDVLRATASDRDRWVRIISQWMQKGLQRHTRMSASCSVAKWQPIGLSLHARALRIVMVSEPALDLKFLYLARECLQTISDVEVNAYEQKRRNFLKLRWHLWLLLSLQLQRQTLCKQLLYCVCRIESNLDPDCSWESSHPSCCIDGDQRCVVKMFCSLQMH